MESFSSAENLRQKYITQLSTASLETQEEFFLDGFDADSDLSQIYEINKSNGVSLKIQDLGRAAGKSTYHNKDLIINPNIISPQMKEGFGISHLEEKKAKQYIFSHENMHHVLYYMHEHHQDFAQELSFLEMIKNTRNETENPAAKTSLGFSQMGSMAFYRSEGQKNPAIKSDFIEDFVELLNKYCFDGVEGLRSYLDLLVHTDKETLKELGLQNISQKHSDNIYQSVISCVENFLEHNRNKNI